jgi:hypothetical protein
VERPVPGFCLCIGGGGGLPWRGGWDSPCCCGDGGLGTRRHRDRLGSGRSRAPAGVRAADWVLGEVILAVARRLDRERGREGERDREVVAG